MHESTYWLLLQKYPLTTQKYSPKNILPKISATQILKILSSVWLLRWQKSKEKIFCNTWNIIDKKTVPIEIIISLYDVLLRMGFMKTIYKHTARIANFLKLAYFFVSFLRTPRIVFTKHGSLCSFLALHYH